MVLKTFVALSASAATVAVVQAALLETNPTTLVPDVVPLGRRHPAYGADVPDEVVEFEVKRPDNATAVDAHDGRRRSLEETSRDIQRLEEHFKASMETRLSEFEKPEFRQAAFERAPWPSSYWPIYQDGINARWDPQDQSPAEKYARAFGHDPKAFMDKVSAVNGVDSMSRRRQCKETTDCASLRDGSICGKREGQSTGRCIPGWFGICHAWAPAAILEREPRCAVQKGNVTFQPFDLKALLTEVYDGVQLPTVFTGARFNGPDEPVKLDKYGRYEDAARRDLGPGFFHIAIANIMGRFKQSFIVDVTAGSEVWNQPVRGYDIQEIRKLSPSAAAQTYFGTSKYVFNTAAVNVAYVKNQFSWIVEGIENGPMVETGRVDVYTRSATYEYLLELDKDDKVIGGEWVGDSRYNHPDFLWFAINKPGADAVTSTNIKYREVQELLEQSIKCEPLTPVPTTPTPTTPSPTTPEPTTPAPTTPSPTTAEPTTPVPTTSAPVTPEPTTVAPATPAPTTEAPTTPAPTTSIPATPLPTTSAPVTPEPTTAAPTPEPTTNVPVTPVPTTSAPVSPEPTTSIPTTPEPTTSSPATPEPATTAPTTPEPTSEAPTTPTPTTESPSTPMPTSTPEPTTATPSTPEPTTTTPSTPSPTPVDPPTSQCGQMRPGVDFYGADLRQSYGGSLDECCQLCGETVGCKAYSYVRQSFAGYSVCYLKHGVGRVRRRDGVVSGEIPTSGGLPTPSPSQDTCQTAAEGFCGNAIEGAGCCPSGSYCQPWNHWYYQCKPVPSQCTKMQPNVDFYGANLAVVRGLRPDECCARCSRTRRCTAFTFIAGSGYSASSCYLKRSTGQPRYKAGAVSGLVLSSSQQ
ncbi:hypothetical protein PINS_up011795 [Pythium insidiosum]|nr:hypothetical protein PINS_up011795 [Pythium insidiosum]